MKDEIISKEQLTEQELNALAEEMLEGHEIEKQALSNAMNPAYDDEERESFLEDAYLQHVKRHFSAKILGKKKFDKFLKDAVGCEFEELKVLNFKSYITGEDHPDDEEGEREREFVPETD